MITLQHLQHAAERYRPILRLQAVFPVSIQSIFRALALVLFILTAFGILLTQISLPLPEFSLLQEQIVPFQGLLVRFAALSLMGWLLLTALTMYFRSYYFAWLPTVLPEHGHAGIALTYELGEILLSAQHPTEAFLASRVGQEILVRAGYEKNESGLASAPLETLTALPWPDAKLYTVSQLVRFLAEHDEPFMRALFAHGVSKDDFLGSAAWVDLQHQQRKSRERKWGKEHLGRIPGIGKELAYGNVYYLDQYATPITTLPDYQEATAQTGGHPETREIEAILSRGREANVLLSGEEGVGKLGILAEIAHEINEGYAFPELEHKKLYVLDGPGLIASNPTKADLEAKIRITLSEAERAGNIILVITDIHLVIQSAEALGSNFVSLLDPFLTSRSLQVVGTTNPQAFFDVLERNPKLLQRFDKVDASTADTHATVRTLERAALTFENRYGLIFTHPALVRLVDNADRFITSGTMPDKALDALAELATLAHQNNQTLINETTVNQFFSATTNIPIGDVGQDERNTLMHLEELLHARVIGQDAAITAIATSMRRARAGIQNPNRPLGSFLFLGPTGVGKTEVSKSLADAFFGSEEKMTRFDMSEYKTFDALEKLTGSFQSGKTGTLTKALKQQPYGLLLLDEFEKSNDQVKDLFLQILDEGVFADMQGKRISARSSLVIATSNAGADKIWDMFQAGKDPSLFTQELIHHIIAEGIYKPELINRFDGVIVFHPLAKSHLMQIAQLMLDKLARRVLEQKGISVTFDPGVIEIVATRGANPQFGARPMNRYILEHVEQIIADQVIAGNLTTGSELHIRPDMMQA
jgi:ATP-dependent Clp protease ATP-binding subunit ClpC